MTHTILNIRDAAPGVSLPIADYQPRDYLREETYGHHS